MKIIFCFIFNCFKIKGKTIVIEGKVHAICVIVVCLDAHNETDRKLKVQTKEKAETGDEEGMKVPLIAHMHFK